MSNHIDLSTTHLEEKTDRRHSRFEELARRAERKLADVRAAELAAEKAHREFQRAENVRQVQVIFERSATEDVREELHPVYSCENVGRGLITFTIEDSRFCIEVDLRNYEENPSPVYTIASNDERALIGTVEFADRALFEARLLVMLRDHLRTEDDAKSAAANSPS